MTNMSFRILVVSVLLTHGAIAGPLDSDTEGKFTNATVDDLGNSSTKELASLLQRKRKRSDSIHREVLQQAGASVPNDNGKFPSSKKTDKQEDEFDWLQALKKLGERKGLAEVSATVSILRALHHKNNTEAATAILDFGFTPHGSIYRDECGRRLRHMAPHSLPALFRAAYQRKSSPKRKYARYQLERLDRESPFNAVNAAMPHSNLLLELVAVLGENRHREAVHVMYALIDDEDPKLRATARKIVLSYLEGPPPPPAPKRKLKLTGGKKTDDRMPLWHNARDLAKVETKNLYRKLFAEKAPRDLGKATRKIYDYFDKIRQEKNDGQIQQVLKAAKEGNSTDTTRRYYKLTAKYPDVKWKASDALSIGEQLMSEGKSLLTTDSFPEAVRAFSAAVKLTNDDESLAYLRLAQARAAGSNGQPLLQAAQKISPTIVENEAIARNGRSELLKFAGIGCALLAIVLTIFGLRKRATA